jgi:hypothetical protein
LRRISKLREHRSLLRRGKQKLPRSITLIVCEIVEFTGEDTHHTHYLRQPFQREPDFGVTSMNYDFAELLARAGEPS